MKEYAFIQLVKFLIEKFPDCKAELEWIYRDWIEEQEEGKE